MAKKHKKQKKHSSWKFALGMFLYAVVFLGATAFGLKWLWGFMENYEASRPHIATDAYMAELTEEHIVEAASGILEQVDLNLQRPEECRQILMDALAEEITFSRKASACTETRQEYVLRSGKQVIGSFVIESGAEDEYGFKPWKVTGETFDLSFLMGSETVSTAVPVGYPVLVNGVALDDSYIISRETEPFDVLEDYYEEYDLPVFEVVTYQAGPFLGQTPELEVTDAEGNPFVYDESYDKYTLIHNCSEARIQELDAFLGEFLDIYITFAGCANDDRFTNFARVSQYVVPGSRLAQRMQEALDGMQFAQSRGDELAEIRVNHYVELDTDVFLCDVTYKVDTTGREGVVQTTTNTRMVIIRQGNKLLVDSMMGY